jgi:hypothetical protein
MWVSVSICDEKTNAANPSKELVLWVSTRGALAVTVRLLLAVTGRLLSESADGVATRKTAGTACSSLMFAR